MMVELQLHDGTLLAVGEISVADLPHNGDRLVVKDAAQFYKSHAAQTAAACGYPAPKDMWYGRVRVVSRKFVFCQPSRIPAAVELTVEDLASGERARGESDWSEPDAERAMQAAIDVAARIASEGSLEKATVRYLYEAMRAAQSNLRRYSPLMLEIEDILKRNGFDK